MRIDVVSIFPEFFVGPFDVSLLGKARTSGLLDLRVHDLRRWATDRHRTVDDVPYGGGAGMVMKPEPFYDAVESVYGDLHARPRTILLTPRGRSFDQAVAHELAAESALLLLCGRYEGIDERVHTGLATDELSVGDYVLAGGEAAACVVVEAITRLLPGVLGNAESTAEESHADGLLEYPQYTRPGSFRGMDVPDVLRSGDHGRVAAWRREQALQRTRTLRPDLHARWAQRRDARE
ncbi:MAG: tRNA (guanosine(37)-N1)-methyltransferase TrmD [Euzebyales bacterium]|jgi:tRNA (guanine37-N1)-methyltransferase|nr:tRNA (guanosine(37)-N1)-methyltransferase TrmD [Euzebyales bacterium]